jgi:hypothetical protein
MGCGEVSLVFAFAERLRDFGGTGFFLAFDFFPGFRDLRV